MPRDDSAGAPPEATALVEVRRVLSIEADSAVGNHDGVVPGDVMIARPVLDTLRVALRRRADGQWMPCGPLLDRVARDTAAFNSPIALTGPPEDTLAPRGTRLTRREPASASWRDLAREADSLSRP